MWSRELKAICFGAVAFTALAGCSVEQTEQGEMPEVSVEGGNLPEFDVEGPDVDVGTETRQVEVPTVDVDLPDGDSADDNDAQRQDAITNR